MKVPVIGVLALLAGTLVGGYVVGFGRQNAMLNPLSGPRAFNVREFGARGDGNADDSDAFDAAVHAATNAATGSGLVFVPPGTYLCSRGVMFDKAITVAGAGPAWSIIRYTGPGSAMTMSHSRFSTLADFALETVVETANGIEVGFESRQCTLRNIDISGSGNIGNVGAGILLAARSGWSGGMNINNCRVVNYKYGIKMIGADVGKNTWTTLDVTGTWLIGRSAGVIPGSAGVYFDENTNGVGTYFRGGTIEAYDVGVHHHAGGAGGTFTCDMEGNNTDFSVGDSFNGGIIPASGSRSFYQTSNGTKYAWGRRSEKSGRLIEEWRYAPSYTVYTGSGKYDEWALYRGDSLIRAGVPMKKFRIGLGFGANDSDSAENFLELVGHKLAWSKGVPSRGRWSVGDVCINTAAVSGVWGYVCIEEGEPGRWRPLGSTGLEELVLWGDDEIAPGKALSRNFVLRRGPVPKDAVVSVIPRGNIGLLQITAFVGDEGAVHVNLFNPGPVPQSLSGTAWWIKTDGVVEEVTNEFHPVGQRR